MTVEELMGHIQQLMSSEEEKQESIEKCLAMSEVDDSFITDAECEDLEDDFKDSDNKLDAYETALGVINDVLRKYKK